MATLRRRFHRHRLQRNDHSHLKDDHLVVTIVWKTQSLSIHPTLRWFAPHPRRNAFGKLSTPLWKWDTNSTFENQFSRTLLAIGRQVPICASRLRHRPVSDLLSVTLAAHGLVPLRHTTVVQNRSSREYFQPISSRENIVCWVVVLPIHCDGRESQKSKEARDFADGFITTPIFRQFFDERSPARLAQRLLSTSELTRKKKKKAIDQIARSPHSGELSGVPTKTPLAPLNDGHNANPFYAWSRFGSVEHDHRSVGLSSLGRPIVSTSDKPILLNGIVVFHCEMEGFLFCSPCVPCVGSSLVEQMKALFRG